MQVRVNLSSQTVDVHLQNPSFIFVFGAPDLAQEMAMGKNLPSIKYQFLQKLVFRSCQYDFSAANSHPSRCEVNLEVTGGKGRLGGYGLR